ncbi:hypothetical protein FQR65_LT02468 [Abscondita terminalis]|nr:hypothetical protein FQR65_LT02468 [Abscondita terminalis]
MLSPQSVVSSPFSTKSKDIVIKSGTTPGESPTIPSGSDRSETPRSNPPEIKHRHLIGAERLTQLRKCVDDAIREHKTFTIKGGWQTIRNQFLVRGWVEKYEPQVIPKAKNSQSNGPSLEDLCVNFPVKQDWESQAAYVLKCERTVMSRMLANHGVDFYWNMKRETNDWHHRIDTNQIMNRFIRSLFTSKEGLNLLLQQLHWYCDPGVANVTFPRCYTLGFPDHYHNFVEDFRLTACVGLIKWLVAKYEHDEEFPVVTPEGEVSHTNLIFALNRCNEFIASQKHLDIDREILQTWDHEWDDYLKNYYRVVHSHALIHASKDWNLMLFNAACKTALAELKKYMPMIDVDGIKNIWILKPGNKCRGRGIQLVKNIEDVTKIMNLKLKYVVQKYIERPLLIYKTKFDIRQWFMITSVQPLCIWMYKECYLRFSTQIFSLENFHESLHLTNHAVQCKYHNVVQRDKALPEQNMWDSITFRHYLKDIGQATKWSEVIYPGLRENIVGVMLACQETMDRRPNTFELYGADFILGEDFKPWLLEINSSPDLSPSTNITKRMCPQCLQDMIKVLIDKRRNSNADTGLFDLVYKQVLPRPPAYLGMNLVIRGRRMFRSKRSKDRDSKDKLNLTHPLPDDLVRKHNLPTITHTGAYSGPVIGDLIEEIQQSVNPGGSEGYQFVPSASGKKKFPSKQIIDNRVSKRQCNSVKTSCNKLNFVNRKQNAKEDKKMDFGYKKLRCMFIKSAYFGLISEWKLKNKFAISPEEQHFLNRNNSSERKNGSSINKENSVLTKTHKIDYVSNKKYPQIPQRLSCINLKLSFPQLHKIEPELNLKKSDKSESKRTFSKYGK